MKKNQKCENPDRRYYCGYDLIEIYAGKRNKSLRVEKELG